MDIFAQKLLASKRRSTPSRLRALLLMMAAVLVSFAGAASVSAATVMRLDMQSLVANSDQIVEGEVTEVEARVEDGRVFTYTTVRVADAFKGAEAGEVVTIRQIGGRTPDLATRVAGSPHFQSGERVIVFLEKPKADALPVITGMAQGKFHIALGPDNLTPYVVPYLGDLALAAPVLPQIQPKAQDDASAQAQGQELKEVEAQQRAKVSQNPQRFERAEPADIYRRVSALSEFKQEIRRVVDEQK